jgi:hypothetical protein
VKRVQTAPVDANGRSTLATANAFQFPLGVQNNPVDIAVAVDGTALAALVVVQNGTTLEVASYSPSALVGSSSILLGAGQRPQIAAAGGGYFWVSFDNLTNDVELCLVGSSNPLTATCNVAEFEGQWSNVLPLTSGAPYLTVVSYQNVFLDGGQRIERKVCDAGACSSGAAAVPGLLTAAGVQTREASVSRTSGPAFTTWEDSSGVFYFPTDAGTALRAAPTLNASRRPVPVMLGTGRAAVIFDSEGNTGGGVAADEILIRRVCLP